MNQKDQVTTPKTIKLIFKYPKVYIFFICAAVHSIYWLTAWLSPWPFLFLNIIAIFFFGPIQPFIRLFSISLRFSQLPAHMLIVGIPMIAINVVACFACLYMFGSVKENGVEIEGMWKHFYFSAITFTTVGYGNIVPSDFLSELIAVIESLVGAIALAIIMGLSVAVALKRLEQNI